jgi:hypothetical protein
MKRRDSKIKGGLKLKNPGINSFDAVMNMIKCPGAKLNVLSYSSSSGFIFKLSIPSTAHDCVQFQGLSKTKTFTNDIYSLVLKLSVINDIEGNIKKPLEIDGERKIKSKENAQAFMNEAKFQQEIFLKTIVPSGNPICLGIADYSYLSSQTDASELLDILIEITSRDSSSRAVLQYIKTNMETSDKLGIISMELADGYTELNELLYDQGHINYEHFFSLSIAEIIILFAKLESKYVNIDFHPKNILIKESTGDVRLIDFGRIANVTASGDSGFPNDEKKNKVILNYNRMFGDYEIDRREAIGVDIFNLYGISYDTIFKNMHKIIKFYCCLDFAINSTYYNSMRPQCMEFVKYIYGINSFDPFDANKLVINKKTEAQFKKISEKIRDIISAEMNGRNSMSRDAVDRKKREGNFLIIDKEISQYNVKYFPKEKRKFQRHPDVFDLKNNAIIFFICCLCLYILKNINFGGARTISLLRKSNPASLSYAASKLSPYIKNDETKIKKNILKFVVKEIKKLNPCIIIDVTGIDANDIIPMSIEEYKEQIEEYKDSITNTKITADECEINSKIYIPDIDSILKIMKKTKAITRKSQSVSELSRSQSVSELSESQSPSELSESQSASEISRSQSASEISRSQSASEISRSLSEGGRRKTRKINKL